jgi:hypothetical protein
MVIKDRSQGMQLKEFLPKRKLFAHDKLKELDTTCVRTAEEVQRIAKGLGKPCSNSLEAVQRHKDPVYHLSPSFLFTLSNN